LLVNPKFALDMVDVVDVDMDVAVAVAIAADVSGVLVDVDDGERSPLDDRAA
jgi:hypothetical protein